MPLTNFLPGLPGAHVLALGTVTDMVLHATFNAQFPPYFAISAAATLFLTYSTFSLAGLSSFESFTDALATNSVNARAAKEVAGMGVVALASLLNLFWAGPMTTKVMLDRKELEMNRKFSILHGDSSLLNLWVVGAVVTNCFWVGLWLGSK
ncbi:hypothetical protein BJ741DRAFT_615244 [Chytriomyces cf. hyalinus JEL632]|nr:hypothetical protein BJ741DRAFT_615244 [Chytriomyces cf. hyalinus JEL632]